MFVHLKTHSEFSLIDGLLNVKRLVNDAASTNMPAVALTDRSNFFGLVKFYKAALAAGVKPIVGAELLLQEGGESYPITFLAQNLQGYKNLTELISLGWSEGQKHGVAYVSRDWLKQYSQGLIVLSGGRHGDIGQALLAGRKSDAEALLQQWMKVFPDRFYLELHRTGREHEEAYLHLAVELAAKQNCPLVATNDVCFHVADDFEAHEARVCIHDGHTLDDPRRARRYSAEQYLRSPEEMQALFADIPSAIENTVEIAKRCSVEIELGKYYLPEFPVPEDMEQDEFFNEIPYETIKQQTIKALDISGKWLGKEDTGDYADELRTGIFFRMISHKGLNERLEFLFDTAADDFPDKQKLYRERLDFELDIILQMGFPGYFLIVMDFIQWAKDHDIPVGPGRGSGAGSLVAYAQKITDLDPIEYDLLFERFLNPERVSMPDFDVDFCMEKRDEVIRYVSQTYGEKAVSQIITFGTMAAKAVVRDVARVQGKSYGLADKLSKMIPFVPGMTLEKALEEEESLVEFIRDDADAAEIWDMAKQLEGVTRNVGKHAGGVVIAPSRLTDFSPIYCDEDGSGLVTQFDKKDVEEAGLVKFDFLGLRTLTIIHWALQNIEKQAQHQLQDAGDTPDNSSAKGSIRSGKYALLGADDRLDIMSIPLDDSETFALLRKSSTTAVFQLESSGMKNLIDRLQPSRFEDIIALVALFRPGPLQSGMVDDFINRKHGRAELAYPHPKYQHESLQPILEPTYGIILYQEQVMQIAQVMGGFTLGGADLLRRAMGKKDADEMAKQRDLFVSGALQNGHSKDLASNIFDLMEKFAGYGFNKSHSAAYALVSYQTAWLKTHYPAAFMAAVLSSELQNTDKIVVLIEECRSMGLVVRPPDVNEGEYMFSVNKSGEIVYGLGAIKGLGEGPVGSLIEARIQDGYFSDLFDFCARTDARKLNKRALEALVRSGCFDSLESNGEKVDRAILFAAIPDAVKAADQQAQNASAGMMDMFGEVASSGSEDVYKEYKKVRPWTAKTRLKGEKDTLGLYLTGHPIDDYERELRRMAPKRLVDVKENRQPQKVCGLLVDIMQRRDKKGNPLAVLTLDDRSARMEATLFADVLDGCKDKLQKEEIYILDGVVRYDRFNQAMSIKVDKLYTLTEARQRYVKNIRLRCPELDNKTKRQLSQLLQPNASGCPVEVLYQDDKLRGVIQLPESYRLQPSDDILQALKDCLGENSVSLSYADA